MFKNFDKVFRFTFKNQVSGKGFKAVTIVIALLLFAIPVAIFTAVGFAGKEDAEGAGECAAQKIYIVDEFAPDTDFSMLGAGVDGNTEVVYKNAATVQAALDEIHGAGETKSLVVLFEKDADEGTLTSKFIIPEASELTLDDANNYSDFIQENAGLAAVLASGIPMENVVRASLSVESDVYKAGGYAKGEDVFVDTAAIEEQENDEVRPIFGMVLLYCSVLLLYFVILIYGNNIMQTVILEKTNKLMDTMLVSINPSAMIFGKMAGVLAAGMSQLMLWIAALAAGIFAGVKVVFAINPDAHFSVLTFLTSLDTQGLFTPLGVILAVVTLLCGITMYAALSAMCGSISSTREEAASNQSTFVIVLLGAFYLILFKGLSWGAAPTWLYLVPFTSAMMLPSAICMGEVSVAVAAAGFGIIVLTTVVGLALAGKLYTFMSLYKGNKVNLAKALKMIFAK